MTIDQIDRLADLQVKRSRLEFEINDLAKRISQIDEVSFPNNSSGAQDELKEKENELKHIWKEIIEKELQIFSRF